MNYKEIIGENIREKRKELGLTIAQLAEEAGISSNFMGNIERGDGEASVPISTRAGG